MMPAYHTVAVTLLLASATAGQETESVQPTETIADQATATTESLRVRPVLVTARRWAEFAQDVPQSLSVLTGQEIRDAGITTVEEASYLVPNLHFTEFSSRRLSFPTFRGISTGVGDPSVTTYVDGVPQLKIGSGNISFLDVDRVEFLRGPQGTLFGRNSIGGVIQLETRRPSNVPELRASATLGNFNLQEYGLSYSGPLVENEWFISVSGMYSERDGYTRNDITGNRVDDRRSTFGRAKLLFTPDDRNEIEFTTYSERSRDGGFVLGFLDSIRANPHHIAVDFEGYSDRDILSNALTWVHDGDDIEITSITSYVDWDIAEQSDFDFSPIDGVQRTTMEEQAYFYQEVRLASPSDSPIELDEDHSLRWIVGGTFFSSDGEESAVNDFRPSGSPLLFPPTSVGVDTSQGDFDDQGFALFGSATLTIMEKFDVSAGVRYDYERKKADIRNSFAVSGFTVFSSTASRRESFDEVAPTFSLSYRPNDDTMVYGRAAKGFKAGGFNLRAPGGSETFGNETSWSYEVGLKSAWFDDRLILNAAFFYIDWEDLQLSLFDAMSGGYIANAGAATSQGFEVELTARATEWLDLFASYGLTDAEFDRFTDQFGMDVSGNSLAFVPDSTVTAGAQLNGEVDNNTDWYLRGEYRHTGTYYLDAGNRESESFGIANFRAGITSERMRLEGWIRNAFDEDYVLVAFQPDPSDPSMFVGENGTPQTYGFTISIQF